MGGGALVDLIGAQPAAGGSALSTDRPFEYELQELAEQVRSGSAGRG
jgi:hypothetical protein